MSSSKTLGKSRLQINKYFVGFIFCLVILAIVIAIFVYKSNIHGDETDLVSNVSVSSLEKLASDPDIVQGCTEEHFEIFEEGNGKTYCVKTRLSGYSAEYWLVLYEHYSGNSRERNGYGYTLSIYNSDQKEVEYNQKIEQQGIDIRIKRHQNQDDVYPYRLEGYKIRDEGNLKAGEFVRVGFIRKLPDGDPFGSFKVEWKN